MYKMGAAAELGLVTTPEEFIPRAGAVNLHTYVFGRSVNFAEVLIPLETLLCCICFEKLIFELNFYVTFRTHDLIFV